MLSKIHKNYALILARGGSKRLVGKNLLMLAGHPLIAWTIKAAQNSKSIDRVYVSTDCEEISKVSKSYGAEVPWLRPADLSSDTSSSDEAILHFLDSLGEDTPDFLTLLQPTSPLRHSSDIDNAYSLLGEKTGLGVVSVCHCDHSPLWANTLPVDNNLGTFIEEKHKTLRSQDLASSYRINGAIYIFKSNVIAKYGGLFYNNQTFAYIMPRERSVDIDEQLDLDFAEFLLKRSNYKI